MSDHLLSLLAHRQSKKRFRYLTFHSPRIETTIYLDVSGYEGTYPHLDYNLNGAGWVRYNNAPRLLLKKATDYCAFRAHEVNTSIRATRFCVKGDCDCGGPISSLCYPDAPAQAIPSSQCFMGIFQDCQIRTPPDLDFTEGASRGYMEMFKGSSITSFPAISLSFTDHFGETCYGMCRQCKNLRRVDFPYSLSPGGRGMWNYLFEGAGIEYIRLHAADWENVSTESWMTGVSATGIAACPKDLILPARGVNSIPSAWTLIRY